MYRRHVCFLRGNDPDKRLFNFTQLRSNLTHNELLSLVQNVVALAMLVQRFDFELDPEAPPVRHLYFTYILKQVHFD